jgi:NAD(P)-dependent dehydrogenase (short-subunit alcohol dehydrogenase family)
MNGQLSGKVAIVTGGGSGIGRATALALAEADARTIVADIKEDAAHETVRLIKQAEGDAAAVRTDCVER